MEKRQALKFIEQQQAFVDRKVTAGIEEYRKADAMLTFKDANGNPVNDLRFHAKLVRHAFDFGCNLFLLDEMETDEKNAIYREKFKEVFNYATFRGFKGDYEFTFDQNGKRHTKTFRLTDTDFEDFACNTTVTITVE